MSHNDRDHRAGDARKLPLPDESADLIVTSPPYWGQRDYRDCGASLAGQIGAEATPQAYVETLLECTAEWMRVLKATGSLFVNLGDKYVPRYASMRSAGRAGLNGDDHTRSRSGQNRTGIPEKSLAGLPWRYALGCIDDLGLTLRAEIVWSKANGLPESVTDRVRRSHEHVFHLTRQPRYFSAVDEIRKPQTSVWTRGGVRKRHQGSIADGYSPHAQLATTDGHPLGSLPGSVWEMTSQPFKAPADLAVDHYAAMPPALARRIILGWSPAGICTFCGEGRRPVTDRGIAPDRPGRVQGRAKDALLGGHGPDGRAGNRHSTVSSITGYICACPEPSAPARPSVVVDPFGGTGTTAMVASVLGRRGVSVDLSADYCRLAAWRTADERERSRAAGRKPQQRRALPISDVGQDPLFEVP